MPFFRTKLIGGLRGALVAISLLPMVSGGAVLLSPSPAAAQDSRVREIRVVGNKRVEPETVRSYMVISVGDAYDAGKVDQSLKALFATGLFSDVKIDRQGAALVVSVSENPVINQIAFEGNNEVEKSTLTNEIRLKPRAVFTRAKVQADVQRILDVYRRQGWFAVKVNPQIIELEHNRVNLVFEINEGKATKVKTISFIGNRAFNDSQLRDVITTTQSGLLDFLKGTNIYDPDRLNLDQELLRQYYLKNGYADARISAANAELDRDGSGFFITFVVEEGEVYRFGAIRIESALPSVDPKALYGELLTKEGQVYNAGAMDKTVERLTLLLSEQGFAFARVRPKADRDPGGRIISLAYVIDEGPRIYIERINVNGNTRTRDHVIRREFRLAEGDAYNPLLVDRAKKRLQALGYFKTVDIKRKPGSTPDRVVLDVDVLEQPTGELSFGAGYSTSEGVIGDISLTERNLLGNGQFVRLRLAGSLERLQIDLSFTEPRFLDRNLSAGFDLFHKETQQSSNSPYRHQKTGGSLRLGVPLSENLWLTTHYTLSYDRIYDVDDTLNPAAGDYQIASRAILEACGYQLRDPNNPQLGGECKGGDFVTSAIGFSVAYDNRNHPKSPTKGVFAQVATDFAGVGGDVQYVRFQAEGRGYYPITEKITLVGRVLGGHILGWGNDDVRLLDLFFKGGETIRGFDKSGIGPRDVLTGDSLGGRTFYAGTAEVRFPLPLVPDEIGMSGAVFADAGSLFGAGEGAKKFNTQCGNGKGNMTLGICLSDTDLMRVTTGVSLIWNSPLGPLRADFGIPLVKSNQDKEQFFRFGIATKF